MKLAGQVQLGKVNIADGDQFGGKKNRKMVGRSRLQKLLCPVDIREGQFDSFDKSRIAEESKVFEYMYKK